MASTSTPLKGRAPAAYSTPTRSSRPAAAAGSPSGRPSAIHLSPAYASNARKHSVYGTEDRVVLDAGSRLWKVGFSGESRPRKVWRPVQGQRNASAFDDGYEEEEGDDEDSVWDLDRGRTARQIARSRQRRFPASDPQVTDEDEDAVDDLMRARILRALRDANFKHLLSDPRTRHVLLIENPLMPLRIKRLMISILFENLGVPSVSFVPSPVVALMAAGRDTGMVVDVGYLETSVTPVFHGRPLYSHIVTTPRAGRAFLLRLRTVIAAHGRVAPAQDQEARRPSPMPVKNATSEAVAAREVKKENALVPSAEEISARLDMTWLEDFRARGCFVGQALFPGDDDLEAVFRSSSTASDATVDMPRAKDGRSHRITVPGWIRERTAEIFFETDDEDRFSVQECILGCLLKLPIDLRPIMISRILVTGGGGMMPGFIPRLRVALLQALMISGEYGDLPAPSPPPPPATSASSEASAAPKQRRRRRKTTKPRPSTEYEKYVIRREAAEFRRQHTAPYRRLAGLAGSVAILNDPSPLPTAGGHGLGGSAPAYTPSLMPWIGASIAGSLQLGGEEVTLEQYRIARAGDSPANNAASSAETTFDIPIVQDWSRPVTTLLMT